MGVSDRRGLIEQIKSELIRTATDHPELLEMDDKNNIEGILGDLLGASTEISVKSLRDRMSAMLVEHKAMRQDFQSRLAQRWGDALDLLYAVYVCCLELGEDFQRRAWEDTAADGDSVFHVLLGLHGQACRVPCEIHAMLSAGFASGALARWRSLHEFAVIAMVIGEYGRRDGSMDLADRFLARGEILNLSDARNYQQAAARIGYQPLTSDELEALESRVQALIDHFGKDLAFGNCAWAASLFPERNPRNIRFKDLEKLCSLDHLRPYYGWTNHGVHADAKGAWLNVTEFRGSAVMTAGPSNAGLADPGHSAAISLQQVTVAFVLHGRLSRDISDLGALQAIQVLVNDAGDQFLAAHRKLEAEEAAISLAIKGGRAVKVRPENLLDPRP
jgi:hypothetical protein